MDTLKNRPKADETASKSDVGRLSKVEVVGQLLGHADAVLNDRNGVGSRPAAKGWNADWRLLASAELNRTLAALILYLSFLHLIYAPLKLLNLQRR